MRSRTYLLVRQAILELKQLVLEYDGREREVCPHAIGTHRGVEKVVCFQFGGYSSRGLTGDNWRAYLVAKMENVRVRAGDWHTSEACEPAPHNLDELDVQWLRDPYDQNLWDYRTGA